MEYGFDGYSSHFSFKTPIASDIKYTVGGALGPGVFVQWYDSALFSTRIFNITNPRTSQIKKLEIAHELIQTPMMLRNVFKSIDPYDEEFTSNLMEWFDSEMSYDYPHGMSPTWGVNPAATPSPLFSLSSPQSIADAARSLPGMDVEVSLPNGCTAVPPTKLYQAIQILNDKYKWTREQIADWLETLDVDLRFGVE